MSQVFFYFYIMKEIRIAYFGTPEFASYQLETILKEGFNVVVVITAPDKPAGRGKKIQQSDVKRTAIAHQLPVLQPERLRDEAFLNELASYQANLFIVVAFRMLPAMVWKMPEYGTFNLHASLLPQYRGAAPINHAIINGEKETGVTTFFINEEIDKGAIAMQQHIAIDDDDNAGTLHDKLMIAGSRLIIDTIKGIQDDTIDKEEQDSIIIKDTMVLKEAPKIFKDFCYIPWNESCLTIYNHIRGLSPYPCAHTRITSDVDKFLDLKIYRSHYELCLPSETIGDIVSDSKHYIKVALRDGYLFLDEVQQAGKKAMPIEDFLRGQAMIGKWKVTLKMPL